MGVMYRTTVRSVNSTGIVGDDGKNLVCIGNYPVNPGDTVWTDGNVVYGHVPPKGGGMIMQNKSGYPIMWYCTDWKNWKMRGLQRHGGYIKETGDWRTVGEGVSAANDYFVYLLNDEKDCYPIANPAPLDAYIDKTGRRFEGHFFWKSYIYRDVYDNPNWTWYFRSNPGQSVDFTQPILPISSRYYFPLRIQTYEVVDGARVLKDDYDLLPLLEDGFFGKIKQVYAESDNAYDLPVELTHSNYQYGNMLYSYAVINVHNFTFTQNGWEAIVAVSAFAGITPAYVTKKYVKVDKKYKNELRRYAQVYSHSAIYQIKNGIATALKYDLKDIFGECFPRTYLSEWCESGSGNVFTRASMNVTDEIIDPGYTNIDQSFYADTWTCELNDGYTCTISPCQVLSVKDPEGNRICGEIPIEFYNTAYFTEYIIWADGDAAKQGFRQSPLNGGEPTLSTKLEDGGYHYKDSGRYAENTEFVFPLGNLIVKKIDENVYILGFKNGSCYICKKGVLTKIDDIIHLGNFRFERLRNVNKLKKVLR